jgi:NADH-quinone oxidoreductase subunit G
MITVTINGKEIQTDPSKTIIDAAFENGVYIPHFCWHPGLSISGNCRMCLVEVEKMPKQVIACSTRCTDGMVVHVNSEKAIKAREAVMEFILINHPLDCPICDEAGECKLQDYTYKFSVGQSRFDEEKNTKRKRDELGPYVIFDAERCISCSRCIRFCEELVGEPQLTFVERGDRVTIETFPGKQLDNPYSMNVIDACPVGALTSKEFRFSARVWDMAKTESVCTGCARGCNMNVWTKQNKVMRLTPRENQNVNDFWMCDKGRLKSFEYVNADTRITQPMLKRDGENVAVTWDETHATLISELRHFKSNEIAFIGSSFDTIEDNYCLNKLAVEVFKSPYMGLIEHVVPDDQDDFLIRADKTPNSTGAKMLGLGQADEKHGLDGIISGLMTGAIKALIISDRKAHEFAPLMTAINDSVYVVVVATNASTLTERADVILAGSTFAEKSGAIVNFDGHAQLLTPALVTTENERWMGSYSMSRLDKFGSKFDRWGKIVRPDCRATWSIVSRVAQLLDNDWGFNHPEDVFDEISAKVPAFAGLDYAKIGRRGISVQGESRTWKVPYAYEDITPKAVS